MVKATHDAKLRMTPMDDSESALRRQLQAQPDNDDVRLQAAMHALRRGAYREAHDDVLQACSTRPDALTLVAERLEALRAFQLHAQMRALVHRCPADRVLDVQTLLRGAAALQSAGLTDEALAWAEQAWRVQPRAASVCVQLALLCIEKGQLDRAQSLLTEVCQGAPVVPIAHWALARLEGDNAPRARIERLQRLLHSHANDPQAASFLGFALYRILAARKQHEAAFAVLQRACAAKRSTLRYDEPAQEALVAALAAEPVTPAEASAAPNGVAQPIFIVGMHRSGTSLLERILEGHPQVVAGGEHYRLAAQARLAANHGCADVLGPELLRALRDVDAAALGHAYLAANAWLADGQSYFTDKLPQNFQLIGLIARALPHARVLHLVRDPLDTCASNLGELFGGANAAYSYHPHELARAYARYRRTMAHWHRVLPGFVLDVSYADLVSDPESTMREVFAFCGLEYRPEALDIRARTSPARSASALQVRTSIHAGSIGRGGESAPLREVLSAALQAAGVEA